MMHYACEDHKNNGPALHEEKAFMVPKNCCWCGKVAVVRIDAASDATTCEAGKSVQAHGVKS